MTSTVAALSLTTGVALASTPAAPSLRSVHMEVQPTGVTVGVGPLGDGFGLLPQTFLLWQTVPPGDTYEGVWYSASILGVDWPLVGRVPYFPTAYDRSVAAGEDALKEKLATKAPGEQVRVVGMSLGAIIADNVASELKQTDTSPDLSYLLIGNPQRTDGGFLTRFGNFTIPILNVTFGRSTPEQSDSPITDVAFQYDFMADFPNYFNPLALANSAFGLVYTHIYPGYLFGNAYPDPDNPDNLVQTVGNTTYITMPTDLPLLFPLRAPLSLIGMGHVVDALDALIRPWVDAAYDRTDDPGEEHPFQFGTPQANIDAAWAKMPEAIQTAIAVLFGAPYHPQIIDTPPSTTGNTTNSLAAAKVATGETVADTKAVEGQSDSATGTEKGAESGATQPGTTESGTTQPTTTESGTTQPTTTESGTTEEPGTTESGTTEQSTSGGTTPGAGEHTGTDVDGTGEDKTGEDTTGSSGTEGSSTGTGTGATGTQGSGTGTTSGSGSGTQGSGTEGSGTGTTGGKHRADDSDDDSGAGSGSGGTESSSTGKHATDTGTTSGTTGSTGTTGGTKTQSTTGSSETGHSEKSAA